MDIETLRAQAAEARARRTAASLSDEETEHAKLLGELAEDTAQLQADERKRRGIAGAAAEAEARRVAAGKYVVKFFDLGSLLPDADPSTLPGAGVLVLRSPPPSALAAFYRELEAGSQDLPQTYAALVAESVVVPDITDPTAGIKFRTFLDGPLGCGTVIGIGDASTVLGGTVAKKAKRGRG